MELVYHILGFFVVAFSSAKVWVFCTDLVLYTSKGLTTEYHNLSRTRFFPHHTRHA